MATGERGPSVRGGHAVLALLIVSAAVVLLVIVTIRHYSQAGDAVAVLSAVVGPLAGVAAAAFGVQLQAAAKAETAKTKDDAMRIADDLASVVGTQTEAEIRDGSSVAGPPMDQLRDLERRLRRLSE